MSLDSLFIDIKAWILGIAGNVLYPVLDPILPAWCDRAFFVAIVSALVSVVAIMGFSALVMMYLTWAERKALGRMQNRYGPNRVGPFGLLQPIADGIKMLIKEDIVPANSDRFVHLMAPLLVMVPTLLVFAVVPFGKDMVAADLDIGVLYFLALSSVTTLALFMAGWASRNKYSFYGAMRAVAQMISYEIPLVLAAVIVVMRAESLSTIEIVEAQSGPLGWFVFQPWGLAAFLIFFTAMIAETNRSPFDLPEGESEIVAGFHTEYSGMKFALFYLAGYFALLAQCFMASTLFLGGWHGPLLPSWLWIFLKSMVLVFVAFLFRGTHPRVRVDQLMGFTWRFLLPLGLVVLFIAGLTRYVTGVLGWLVSIVILVVAVVALNWPNRAITLERRTYRFES